MPGNSIGDIFRVTTFGESHGPALGVVIDGCPAGIDIDMEAIRKDLARRRPGQSSITTSRREEDEPQTVSGIFQGKTTGAPLAFLVRNKDQKPGDYEEMKETFRPSHADFTWTKKYGHVDHRGGGRASARETAMRVIAGSVARQLLAAKGVSVHAWVSQAGNVIMETPAEKVDISAIETSIIRCPDQVAAKRMIALIEKARDDGDSVGGRITCIAKGVPAGLGEPVFDKLHADLAKAMMSINAAKGFEIGSGFSSMLMKGSEHNDEFTLEAGQVKTATNNSGGVQGGISNGMDIWFNVAFKPPSTIRKRQHSVNKKGEEVIMEGKGRHDPCVLPRAVPVVEAMAAIILADHYLRNKAGA